MQKNGSKKQLIFEKWEHFDNGQNGHNAKAIAHAKYSVWVKKLNCEKAFYKHIKIVLCKKRLEKTANIRKMGAFLKCPKMATMQTLWPMQKTQFGSKHKIA